MAAIFILGVAAYLLYRKSQSQAGAGDNTDGGGTDSGNTDSTSVVDKITSIFGGGGQDVSYTFPNGFADLDNWKDADDGSNSFENNLTRFMLGIAKAEGYGIPGAIPTVANNPGDLTSSLGFQETGSKLGSAGIVEFINRDNGWAALEHELRLALSGKSTVYNPGMTLQDFANKYTATQPEEWARNVANTSGFPVDTPLNQIFA